MSVMLDMLFVAIAMLVIASFHVTLASYGPAVLALRRQLGEADKRRAHDQAPAALGFAIAVPADSVHPFANSSPAASEPLRIRHGAARLQSPATGRFAVA